MGFGIVLLRFFSQFFLRRELVVMNSKFIKLPTASNYGAVEVKKWIGKYTLRSFVVTMMALSALVVLQNIVSTGEPKTPPRPPIVGNGPTVLGDFPTPDDPIQFKDPIPEPVRILGIQSVAGVPIAIPDLEIEGQLDEFASIENIHKATSVIGTGYDPEELILSLNNENNVEVNIQQQIEHPDPEEFYDYDVEPQCDIAEIQKLIVYPEMALRLQQEGDVTLRVLIGADGRALEVKFLQSDSRIFEEAARLAIMKYEFLPAIQNQKPVSSWLTIPIRFRLK
jgi:TonB family protein